MQARIQIVLLVALLALPPDARAEAAGIVVEEARPGGSAERAGIAPGDLLLGWRGEAATDGAFSSPFDLAEVEIEQGSRGVVMVDGRRGGEPLRVSLSPGRWGLETRPRLSASRLESYDQARHQLAAGEVAAALARFETLARGFEDQGEAALAIWMDFEIAKTLAGERRWEKARATLEAATKIAETEAAPGPQRLLEAHAKERLAAFLVEHGDLDTAGELYRQALRLRAVSPAGAESLGVARILNRLGALGRDQGHYDEVQGHLHRALEIGQRQAPDSLVVAETLSQLAVVLGLRSDMDGAIDHLRRALAIQERLAPHSPDMVSTLNRLGLANRRIGDLAAAAGYYQQALEIQQNLAPEDPATAKLLTNFGVLAMKQGDLVVAEDCFWRAWEISQQHMPRSLTSAGNLANLGSIFESRGDLETAARYQHRALEIIEQLTPESPDVAIIHDSLGNLAFGDHDLDQAERHYQRALTLRQREMPDSLATARSWRDLGAVASERGDNTQAEKFLRRALDIERRVTPGGLDLAHTLGLLGQLAMLQDRWSDAEPYLLEALAIHQRLAPGTLAEAISCQRLATSYRRLGRLRQARELYARGTAAFEAQEHRLGGSYIVRSGFAASRASLYAEYVDFLVERGELAEAFHLLERSRNRAFLEFLGQRDLSLAADVPPELEHQRRLADARYNDALARLAHLSAETPETLTEDLHQALSKARHEQQEIKTRIRLAAPRVAALRYAEPLDLAATQQALDPGTLLLAYSLGEERGHLFAIGPGPGEARVYPIPRPVGALREEVRQLRSLLRPGETSDAIRFRAAQLGELLLGAAADPIERAERLLILPDGPLHSLPFAALVLADQGGQPRYLVESKPITVAASATFFAQLAKGRHELGAIRLSAFGDPLYPDVTPALGRSVPVLRSAMELGLRLDPLPATRSEIEGLGALFPKTSHIFLGATATEERAKSLGKDSNVIHFACHGVVDDRLPLESALVLSLPSNPGMGEENGLLQAWEIFEQMRIDAELVTLSACDTALGQELAGEGMLGLVRAFQYAGARSVLASLWGVHDASTAELMAAFYRAWKQGRTKDEALRGAQLELLGGEGLLGHPFYWAAFELIGDWR